MALLTTKQMLKKYQISRTTLYRRQSQCEQSPYRDAIIHDGPRRIYFKSDRWDQFLEYRNRQYYKNVYGLDLVRDKGVI